jgi:hypothetical protein
MELRQEPTFFERLLRVSLIALTTTALFTLILAIVVVVVTD